MSASKQVICINSSSILFILNNMQWAYNTVHGKRQQYPVFKNWVTKTSVEVKVSFHSFFPVVIVPSRLYDSLYQRSALSAMKQRWPGIMCLLGTCLLYALFISARSTCIYLQFSYTRMLLASFLPHNIADLNMFRPW
jgi:hypothetical protein